MNSFRKCLIALFLTGVSYVSDAQDLMRKIPAEAIAVATVKGKNLTELMSLAELNNSITGKKLLKKLSEKSDKAFTSVENTGFNLSASSYYYNQSNDSVTYNCFLIPVKDASQVDALYRQAGQKFSKKGEQRSHYNTDSTEVARWNNEMFLFVLATGNKEYFQKPEVMGRFGLEDSYPVEEAAVADSVAVAVEAEDVVLDTAATEVAEYDVPDSAMVVETVADDAYFAVRDQKKTIVAAWTLVMMDDFFAGTNKTSLMDNPDFVKSLDPRAEASVWVSGVDRLFNTYMPTLYIKGMSFLNGYGTANAQLYLEDKTMRVTSSLTFSKEIAEVFKRVQTRKLNKRFLNYVNEDRMIGYLGYALDTKTYLEEYPKLLSKIYGSMYSEEINMAADLFSLLLDEEAISKVIKGDALFVFNGLSQKEVTYKSYEYNEDNFESKEVTKTKKETLPDFLMMISSEDTRLIDKLIAYGVKKEMIKSESGYYELSIPKSPLALYFTIKDGIIFFGTSKAEMVDIAANRYVAKVSAKHKKMLIKSNYSAYFSAKKLAGKIPSEELGGAKKLEKVNGVLNALGDIYLNSNAIKGNTVSGQMSMDIPANQPNALKYLFSIIEGAQK